MPLPIPTTIATGFADAVGCDYRQLTDQLLIVTSVAVPPPGPTPWDATVGGDPTSTHCAHSFFLNAWDRIINGWGYIHGPVTYQKSVTLML